MRSKHLIPIVLATAVDAAVTASPALAGGWSDPQRVGAWSDPAMVVTPTGRLHVVARGTDGGWYLRRDRDGTWRRFRLTRDVIREDPGWLTYSSRAILPSIARDPLSSSLVVAYTLSVADGSTGGCGSALFVGRLRDGRWASREAVNRLATCPGASSLASRGGRLLLALDVWDDYGFYGNVALAWKTADGWTNELVRPAQPSNIEGPADPALLLDPRGHARLAYTAPTSVRYAYRDDGDEVLVRERIARTGERPAAVALALDGAGRPWIAWATDTGTFLARRTATHGWRAERVARGATDVALALDAAGRPHVLVARGAAGVWYGRPIDGAWRFTQVDDRSSRLLGGLRIDRQGRLIALWQHGDSWRSPVLWMATRHP